MKNINKKVKKNPLFGGGFKGFFLLPTLVQGLPCEERLLHVGELLEGHVLDDGRQLVMVPDHDPPLQPVHAVLIYHINNSIYYCILDFFS